MFKSLGTRRFLSLLSLVALGLSPQLVRAGPLYRLQDLGIGEALAINAGGQVVGRSGDRGFYFDGVRRVDLVLPDTTVTVLVDINDAGIAVGTRVDSLGFSYPIRTNVVETMTLPFQSTGGTGINNRGEITITGVGLIVSPANDFTVIPPLPGSELIAPKAINDSAIVAGTAYFAGNQKRAFRYANGETTDLGSLVLGGQSLAEDINETGDVVGISSSNIAGEGAVLWRNGEVIELSAVTGRIINAATAINNTGKIVGYGTWEPSESGQRAILVDGEEAIDLSASIDASGWSLTFASDINHSGQIVGTGLLANQEHAFLLTPIGAGGAIPLPPALVPGLATLGLAAAMMVRSTLQTENRFAAGCRRRILA